MTDCPICLNKYPESEKRILHDSHTTCQTCYEELRNHFVMSCPLCRTSINEDLTPQIQNNNIHLRIISDIQLRCFNISQEYIDILHLEQRIPFYYMGRFEGVDFIRQVQADFNEWERVNFVNL